MREGENYKTIIKEMLEDIEDVESMSEQRKRYIIETIEQIADENKLGKLYYFIKGFLGEGC